MNSFLKSSLIICLALFVSCEKNEQQDRQSAEEGSTVVSESEATSFKSLTSPHSQEIQEAQSSPAERAGEQAWLGKVLRAEDKALFEQWAQDLSRDTNEQLHRKQQTAHLRRAEVLTWNLSDQDLAPLKAGDEPREISFPFFEYETLTVVAAEIRRYGEKSVFLQGHLADEPETEVYLSLTEQAPAATIEGPDTLYYYEAFEGVAILREDEPGSQREDFNCNCEAHQAARGE